jgi:alkanesulfonate monooxygenase SsuD/methylene tetrahydromethanopterin reductase-like flavin-dependent oxidoreductase (luciferase family)
MNFGLFQELQTPTWKSEARTYGEMFMQIEYGESVGFESVWFVQHHFNRAYSIIPSPLVVIAAAAQRTRRMRLGCAVSLLPFNHPIRNAEDAATADVVSGGRLEFGAGRGVLPDEFMAFGVGLAESRPRFLENLAIIKKCWTGRFTHRGRFHQFENVEVFPKPVQKPHPPVWITAVSPETFTMVGEMGHRVLVSPAITPFAALEQSCKQYRGAYQAAGHDPANRRIGVLLPMYIAPTQSEALGEVRKSIEDYFVVLKERFKAPPGGFPPEYQFYQHMEQDLAGLTFEDFCAEGVFGTPQYCVDRLKWMRETIGVDEVLCWLNVGGQVPHESVLRAERLLAEEVMPAFAA